MGPLPSVPPRADKRSLVCECTAREQLAPGIVRLEFAWPGPAPGAGQFFLLRPERTGVFLARPFSAASWRPAGDSAGAGLLLSFLAAPRGRGSAELTGLRPGERAELLG
ncbi:MAG: hypothetical protein LBL43_05590, partial [Treponema sp.]|nr:hypothetical protein [Treponema sp.]